MYLIGHRRSCRPHGTLICGTLSHWAMLLVKFLQRAERAQPAAEGSAAPEQKPCRDGGPQDEDQRRGEEELPVEAGDERVREGQDVHDGELGVGVPAEPDQVKAR